MLFLQQLVAWPVTLCAAHFFAKASIRETCVLTRFPLRSVPAMLAATLGVNILLQAVATSVRDPSVTWALMSQRDAQANPLALILATIVIAPFAEEWFCRGLILRGFRSRYSDRTAIWLSSILFAAFHLDMFDALLILPGGLWCAWLFVRSGSLLPGIIVHAMAGVSISFIIPSLVCAAGSTPEEVAAQHDLPVSVLWIGVLLALVGGLIHRRQFLALGEGADVTQPPTTQR